MKVIHRRSCGKEQVTSCSFRERYRMVKAPVYQYWVGKGRGAGADRRGGAQRR